MSTGEMESNAALILPAGTEPLSEALSGALYLLGKDKHATRELRKELDNVFHHEDQITMSAVARLPYLQAVIEEALRMYPPFSGGNRRQAPPEGAMISGHFVPGGTIVSVPQMAAYSHSYNFNRPYDFIPERWLPASDKRRVAFDQPDETDVFKPFSTGPQNCIGKGLAYAEMRMILARLIWRFEFELVDDRFAFEKQRVFLFREKPPLRVKARERKHVYTNS